MTIPAPLPAPTPAQISTQLGSTVSAFMATQAAAQFVASASGSAMNGIQAVIVAWTNHDGTMGFMGVNALDPVLRGADAVTIRGLIAEYGAVTIQVYTFTPVPLTDTGTLNAVTTTEYQDPTKWAQGK